MSRDRLKKLAADERFISGIYSYCDRWCERCPQTSRCLNFSISEEEFSDPETHDIRNEAFWKKLSEISGEALKLLREAGKKWGIELETLDLVGTQKACERMRRLRKTMWFTAPLNATAEWWEIGFKGKKDCSLRPFLRQRGAGHRKTVTLD